MGSTELRFGPYADPDVSVGEWVYCHTRGWVRVFDWAGTPVKAWPRGLPSGPSPGHPSLILMGDLVTAVQREAATAVAHHWGVSVRLVTRWRRALRVDRTTEGTRARLREIGRPHIGAYSQIGAAALNSDPEARARRAASHAATMRRKPGISAHMQALSRRFWDKKKAPRD